MHLKHAERRVGIHPVHSTADFVCNTGTNNGWIFSVGSVAFTAQDNSFFKQHRDFPVPVLYLHNLLSGLGFFGGVCVFAEKASETFPTVIL